VRWTSCRQDGIIAKHPDLEGLMHNLTAITTHVNKSSQALDHARKCGELGGVDFSQEHGQDEVVVILHPGRVLRVEHQDLALSARLPS